MSGSGWCRVAWHRIRDLELDFNQEGWREAEGATMAKPDVKGVRLGIVLLGWHCQRHGHGIDIAATIEGYGPRWTFA